MSNQRHLTATGLRLILALSLVVIAGLTAGGFYFFNGQLQTVALDVSQSALDAKASQNNLQTLQKIQKELREDQDIVQRASSIVAESKSYHYQDQIITDLGDYANSAGVTITNIDFSTPGQTGANSPSSAKAATPTPVTTPAPAGVKPTSVAITLRNPVGYLNLLRFIRSIEQNLTKMHISKVSLVKDATNNSLTSEAFTIEVYIQ